MNIQHRNNISTIFSPLNKKIPTIKTPPIYALMRRNNQQLELERIIIIHPSGNKLNFIKLIIML